MSTSSQEGIRANRSRKPGKGKAKKTRATSGPTSLTPFAQYDQDTHSWKTCEATLLSASETFSPTLPPAGILRNGRLSQRPRLAHHIAGIASSSWPTPTTQEKEHLNAVWTEKNRRVSSSGTTHGMKLADAVKRWPTPTTQEVEHPNALWTENYRRVSSSGTTHSMGLADAVQFWPTPQVDEMKSEHGGKLNPTWVEWLMGFPLGWTDLGDSETPSSRKSPKSSEG